jgi:hypothetical protein
MQNPTTTTTQQTAIVPTNPAIAAMQQQQAKLQAQIVALQAQQQAIHNLQQGVVSGNYFIVNPSNAQTNVGVNNLPKAVTLILQMLPLVNNPAILPAQQQQITQLLLQAASQIEICGNVPLARQRIARA